MRLRLRPARRHGGPYHATPRRPAPVLVPKQLAADGFLAPPRQSQASDRALTMSDATALWRAVIAQAIEDATRERPVGENGRRPELERKRARDWLTLPSADFDNVCALAELHPD